MTTSTESNKIKNEEDVTDTATLQDGKKLKMMTAGNEKDKEEVDEEVNDNFDVDHAPESMLEEGKLSCMGMRKRAAKTPLTLSRRRWKTR